MFLKHFLNIFKTMFLFAFLLSPKKNIPIFKKKKKKKYEKQLHPVQNKLENKGPFAHTFLRHQVCMRFKNQVQDFCLIIKRSF